MMRFAAAGAEGGLYPEVTVEQFAADAVEFAHELEEAAYDIAGVIEGMPEYRMISMKERQEPEKEPA